LTEFHEKTIAPIVETKTPDNVRKSGLKSLREKIANKVIKISYSK